MEDNKEFKVNESHEKQSFIVEPKNSFSVTRNSKGFNYEFKIIEDDLELLKQKVLMMTTWAKEQFGDKNEK